MSGQLSLEPIRDGLVRVQWRCAEEGAVTVSLRETPHQPGSSSAVGVFTGGSADFATDQLHPIVHLEGPRGRGVIGQRRVPLPGSTNLRDLGGYPTTDGGQTRWGLLYRADAVVDESAQELASQLGIRSAFDLRTGAERRLKPTIWNDVAPSGSAHIPIGQGLDGDASIGERLLRGEISSFTEDDLVDHYWMLLQTSGPAFAGVVEALVDAESTPTLFHCAAGKDRTGLMAALILDVLGVRREAIIEDYVLTQVYRPNREQAMAPRLRPLGIDAKALAPLFASPPDAMRRTLELIDEYYGSAAQYVTSHAPISPAALDSLTRRLVDPLPQSGEALHP